MPAGASGGTVHPPQPRLDGHPTWSPPSPDSPDSVLKYPTNPLTPTWVTPTRPAPDQGGALPSIEALVRQYGKRLLVVSGTDYGPAMAATAFNHSLPPCALAEPLFQ